MALKVAGTVKPSLNAKSLRDFEKTFDPTRENAALHSRGQFIDTFPISRLRTLKFDDYVIGKNKHNFCYHVEVQTRPWASIQGATSFKFGIYFGKTKSNDVRTYRWSDKFGNTKIETFRAVKSALLTLISDGGRKKINFAAIDENPLSQMFKAKILSLYFPDKFLNVCSKKHIENFAAGLGLGEAQFTSEYQNLLAQAKKANRITRTWSNPKFMAFLYAEYDPEHDADRTAVRKPTKKRPGTVNFEELQKVRSEIGKKSEAFAIKWEKRRLKGAGLTYLIKDIDDRRNRPGYGYDFLSFSSDNVERYIEVKTVAKVRSGGHRCFVSETELNVSRSSKHASEYYFYLVSLGSNGEPKSVTVVRADKQYEVSELLPAAYEMRFELELN